MIILTTLPSHHLTETAVPALQSVASRMSSSCNVLLLQNGIMEVYKRVHQQVVT